MEIGGVTYTGHHTGLVVSNLERSIAFYRDLLGLELMVEVRLADPWIGEMTGLPSADLRIACLKVGGSDHFLEVIHYESPRGDASESAPINTVGSMHVCLAVEDLDAVCQRLRSAGVDFHTDPVTILGRPEIRLVYFRDPDGMLLELVQATL